MIQIETCHNSPAVEGIKSVVVDIKVVESDDAEDVADVDDELLLEVRSRHVKQQSSAVIVNVEHR